MMCLCKTVYKICVNTGYIGHMQYAKCMSSNNRCRDPENLDSRWAEQRGIEADRAESCRNTVALLEWWSTEYSSKIWGIFSGKETHSSTMKTGPFPCTTPEQHSKRLFLSILLHTAVHLHQSTLHEDEIYSSECLDNRNLWVFSVSWYFVSS